MNNDKFCKAGEFENFRYRWAFWNYSQNTTL